MTFETPTLPGIDAGVWQIRDKNDPFANALADRHYSRRRPKTGQIGPPGRKLIFVTPCSRAVWLTHWPKPELSLNHLDSWRCTIFRNEGAGLSSHLIREAMELTARRWAGRPADGWVTWVDRRFIQSTNPGYCFLRAGWWRDNEYRHPYLIRLRASVG